MLHPISRLLCLPALLCSAYADQRVLQLPEPLREQGRTVVSEPNDRTRAELADALGKSNPAGTRDFYVVAFQLSGIEICWLTSTLALK